MRSSYKIMRYAMGTLRAVSAAVAGVVVDSLSCWDLLRRKANSSACVGVPNASLIIVMDDRSANDRKCDLGLEDTYSPSGSHEQHQGCACGVFHAKELNGSFFHLSSSVILWYSRMKQTTPHVITVKFGSPSRRIILGKFTCD